MGNGSSSGKGGVVAAKPADVNKWRETFGDEDDLDFTGNDITVQDGLAIAEIIKDNTTVEELNLTCTYLPFQTSEEEEKESEEGLAKPGVGTGGLGVGARSLKSTVVTVMPCSRK